MKKTYGDSYILHKQVRVGKNRKAILVTKFRTQKPGDHGTYEKENRQRQFTLIGRFLKKTHLDEFPQVWNLIKREVRPVGVRMLIRQDYQKLHPELKKIYDEMGPGLIGIEYACKKQPPTVNDVIETTKELYEMWKKSPTRAYFVYGWRAMKNIYGREIPNEARAMETPSETTARQILVKAMAKQETGEKREKVTV